MTLSGCDVYLGPHGTVLSKNNYDRVVAEWLAAGRVRNDPADTGLLVVDLIARYVETEPHALARYPYVLKLLVRLYEQTPAAEFGPLSLRPYAGSGPTRACTAGR